MLVGQETWRPVVGVTLQPRFTVPWKLFRGVSVSVVDPWLPVKLTGLVAEIPKSTTWKTTDEIAWDKDPPRRETAPVIVTV
jgi:hypothetical protein